MASKYCMYCAGPLSEDDLKCPLCGEPTNIFTQTDNSNYDQYQDNNYTDDNYAYSDYDGTYSDEYDENDVYYEESYDDQNWDDGEDYSKPPKKQRSGAFKRFLIIAASIVVIVGLGFATAYFVLLPLLGLDMGHSSSEYIEYLEGVWLSEEFSYKDDADSRMVEIFTVKADGSFTLVYAVPDQTYPEGFKGNNWPVEYEISGTLNAKPQDQRLILLYSDGEEKYYYDRYFVLKDPNSMCLREYYDQTQQTYFDMIFTKVG